MKNERKTYYLGWFLLVGVVIVGVLLCCFSGAAWWNRWMVVPPVLFMVLGALFCPMMKKNLDAQVTQQRWLLVYKGIKMGLTIAMLVLYLLILKEHGKAFVLVTAIAYFIGLMLETGCVMHYLKRHNQ